MVVKHALLGRGVLSVMAIAQLPKAFEKTSIAQDGPDGSAVLRDDASLVGTGNSS
jgi:hypothetical protein